VTSDEWERRCDPLFGKSADYTSEGRARKSLKREQHAPCISLAWTEQAPDSC